MKKIFTKLMLLAVAATALASCAIDDTNDVNTLPGVEVSINATTTDVSRSVFGDYNSTSKKFPTLWEGTEKWFVAVNDKYVEKVETIIFSDDKKSANASFTLSAAPTAADGKYTLHTLSPASAYSHYDFAGDKLRFNIARAIQTPTATSCDPASQVLFAKSEAVESVDSFNVGFEHMSAYVKFSFLNVAEGGVVSSVEVSSADVNLAGRYEYKISTGTFTELDNLSKSITLVTDHTDNLWMAVAPVDVSGKKLTFSITTDKGILSKEVTMPETAKFESGKVVGFNIDMDGIEYPSDEEGEQWQLVTDTADLYDGEFIIVALNKNGDIIYLPSTTTGSSSAPAHKIISVPGLDLNSADVFTTTLIPEDARFAFSGSASSMTIKNADGKYLYTINDNNGLRINTTNDTWSIQAHSTAENSLTLKSASQSRYIAVNDGSKTDWRCYTAERNKFSAAADQNGETYIYKKVTNDPVIVASNIKVAAEGGSDEASYEIKNYKNDDVTGESNKEWLTAVVVGGKILWEAEPNYTGADRSAEIVLTSAGAGVSKTITVWQATDVFTVSATSVSLKSEVNSTATFTVTSTYAATIAVSDSDKWEVTPTSVADGASAVTITVKAKTANATAEAVTGQITITRTADGKELTVTASQAAAEQGGGSGEVVETTVTFVSKDHSYANGAEVTSAIVDSNISLAFASGSKYYNTGEGIRVYGGKYFTVSSSTATITKITLTFGSGDGSNAISADCGTFTSPTWTGSSNSVKFSLAGTSGHRRIAKIAITYQIGGSSEGGNTGGGEGGETPDPTPDPEPDPEPGTSGAKTYTLTITKSDFTTKSYADNNKEHTSTATASDGSTMQVKWTSNQVYQNGDMQWQKSNGYIYNSTDLGTINSVTVETVSGSFTKYIGSSKQPTTNGSGGYFQVKTGGSATGHTNSITVTFTK